MNSKIPPDQALRHIIVTYGRALLQEPKRVESLLNDLCTRPEDRRDIHVLMLTLKENIPSALLADLPINEIGIQRLIQRLCDASYFPENVALKAIQAWGGALGVVLPVTGPQFAPEERQPHVAPPPEGPGPDYGAMSAAELRTHAVRGIAEAQNNLGVMYSNGEGVEKNPTEAVKWYRRAAEQGYALGQNRLGLMYYYGHGVEKNPTEAVKWYRRAAEQGSVWAQNYLGAMYSNGEGVEKNKTEAVKWFRRAAEQGLAEGQNRLGLMYYYGHGVEKNPTEAVKWFRLAAKQGDAGAVKALKLLKVDP